MSAIRYTFADASQSYDELLAPLLVDFLSSMVDEDLVSYIISPPVVLVAEPPLIDRPSTCFVLAQLCSSEQAASRSRSSHSPPSELIQGNIRQS